MELSRADLLDLDAGLAKSINWAASEGHKEVEERLQNLRLRISAELRRTFCRAESIQIKRDTGHEKDN